MNDPNQVDYEFWSKLDGWSFRDAALLLCGFDPDQTKGLVIAWTAVITQANLPRRRRSIAF